MPTNKLRLYANVQSAEPSKELSAALAIPSVESRQLDLQYITAVFVSSGYNLNSAYFLPSELYKSRNTIVEKPLDVEHDQERIVGHMYSSVFANKDGSVFCPKEMYDTLGNEIDKVSMDIIVAMRLYKERFPEIAEDVNNGDYKVSMECFYRDFDIIVNNIIIPQAEARVLGLVDIINNKIVVVEGAEDKGKHRVGRVLRDMVFSGCGLVKNPANPESIILETATIDNNYILDLTKVGSYMNAKQAKEAIVIHSLEGTEKTHAYVSASFGGSHRHDVSTEKPKTFADGSHNHLVWPDSVPEDYDSVYFVSDGEHRHSFNTKTGKLGQEDGHVHKVYIDKKDGGYNVVESGPPKSKHTHEFIGVNIDDSYDYNLDKKVIKKDGNLGETSYGGSHYHEIELEDGVKLKTVTPIDILKMKGSVESEEAGTGWVDGRPLSTPESCVSFKRYVYTKGGDNHSAPVNSDYPGVVPQVDSNPAPGVGGAGDTITQDDTIIHENWCVLFDVACTTPGGMAVHPECLRLVLDRTTKDVVSNYLEKLQENRKSAGVSKALSSLNSLLEETKVVTGIK